MEFSVVGLPHYTVWHLYEPSVDDIRHMQEMEQERLAREKEERERAERVKKIKEEFGDPNNQWEKDKKDIEGITRKDEEAQKPTEKSSPGAGAAAGQANEQKPIAQPAKDGSEAKAKTESAGKGNTKETKDVTAVKNEKDTKEAKGIKDVKAS